MATPLLSKGFPEVSGDIASAITLRVIGHKDIMVQEGHGPGEYKLSTESLTDFQPCF